MREKDIRDAVRMESPLMYNVWRFILKFIAPLAVAIVLVNGLL